MTVANTTQVVTQEVPQLCLFQPVEPERIGTLFGTKKAKCNYNYVTRKDNFYNVHEFTKDNLYNLHEFTNIIWKYKTAQYGKKERMSAHAASLPTYTYFHTAMRGSPLNKMNHTSACNTKRGKACTCTCRLHIHVFKTPGEQLTNN